MYRFILTILVLFISTPSFAHAGHDHSDSLANLIHLAWIAPLIIVSAFFIHKLVKRQRSLNKQ